MVLEKETKMKEQLKIQGLKATPYGLSFLIIQLSFQMIIAGMVTFNYYNSDSNFVDNIEKVLLPMLLVSVDFILYSMLLTTFFSSAKMSTQVG